jgi:hypothetical protein
MTQLSTKIKIYANQEIDFLKDVLLQDDVMQWCLHQGMEPRHSKTDSRTIECL